jgi:DNA-binding XRE family transcriptional regulator
MSRLVNFVSQFIKKIYPELSNSKNSNLRFCVPRRSELVNSKKTIGSIMKGSIEYLSNVIAKNVRLLRESLNMSQEELALHADVHRAYIGQVERAERNLTLRSLQKIADGLGVDVTQLLSE